VMGAAKVTAKHRDTGAELVVQRSEFSARPRTGPILMSLVAREGQKALRVTGKMRGSARRGGRRVVRRLTRRRAREGPGGPIGGRGAFRSIRRAEGPGSEVAGVSHCRR
jgi:hypothetical protein